LQLVNPCNYRYRDAHFHSYTLKSREFANLGNSKDIPINANPISIKNSAHLDILIIYLESTWLFLHASARSH